MHLGAGGGGGSTHGRPRPWSSPQG
jgi:hypothetical protein